MNFWNTLEGGETMTMPSQTEIEQPLLKVINSLGGKAKPKELYEKLTKEFPDLTQFELEERLESGGNKWTNRIQWARQKLVDKGELCSPERGYWEITHKGIERIKGIKQVNDVKISFEAINLVELYDKYEEDFKSQLLDTLQAISPEQFEEFSKKLLQIYGFVDMTVTAKGPDGGIDGHGRLKVGLATMKVAFQCKCWQSNVGSKEVQQFRGAIQGEYQQGIFFTTSDFTAQAASLSIKEGAVPVILMNGSSIVDIMIEKGFGVNKKPLYLYYDRVSDVLESS